MKQIKECYENELKRVTEEINKNRGDFLFSLVADTHLDNSLPDTLNNIAAVDEAVGFDCMLHLGDFMNGNIPKNYTHEILSEQMKSFASAIKSGEFYPAQGNHDGYTNLCGSNDIALDEDWAAATEFIDTYKNASRPENKPYFYVDYPEKKLRLIVICSFFYNSDFYSGANFAKQFGIDEMQIKWLKDDALNLDSDWTVMLFSHDTPFSNFDEKMLFEDNARVNGSLALQTLIDCRKERGFDIAAWFIGHFHGELIKSFYDVNFIIIGSQTAYVPQLWSMPEGGFYYPRVLETDTEDLWDAVIWNKSKRLLRLVRFGVGADREVTY